MIVVYVLVLVAITIFLSSIVPVSQYLYYKFVKRGISSTHYCFSENLFNCYLNEDGCSVNSVINNRDEMEELWKKEIECSLP